MPSEQQRAAEDVDEERDEELGDRVHVAVDPLDHLAGRMLAVVPMSSDSACAAISSRRRFVAVHAWRLATHVAHDGRALRADGDDEVERGDRDELAWSRRRRSPRRRSSR